MIVEELSRHADSERAENARRYLKSSRTFLGVSVPACRRVVDEALKGHAPPDHDALLHAVAALWDGPYFECRLAAVELLTREVATLDTADLAVIEEMIRGGETWALVDPLATDVAGAIVAAAPGATGATLDRWAGDTGSFWLRRASMLALLRPLRSGGGDWERFCRYADSMLTEREFFIRKAIGWILRDTSRRRPDLVRAWVEPRLDAMSGVTRREAVKYL